MSDASDLTRPIGEGEGVSFAAEGGGALAVLFGGANGRKVGTLFPKERHARSALPLFIEACTFHARSDAPDWVKALSGREWSRSTSFAADAFALRRRYEGEP